MKVRLEYDEACRYYEKNEFSVHEYCYADEAKKEKRYGLFWDVESRRVLGGKYHSDTDVFERLVLSIPAEVDLALGRGFVDPLRMMPIAPDCETDAAILRLRELGAIMAWATVGTLDFEVTKLDGGELRIPFFKLGEKVGRSKSLLVWTTWNREIDWESTGISKTALLKKLIDRRYLETDDQNIIDDEKVLPYFERISDDYGMSGMEIFVIPLSNLKQYWNVKRWLNLYRKQKWNLIREGEKIGEDFAEKSAEYMREILMILPGPKKLPDNIDRIAVDFERLSRHKMVWKSVKVTYCTGKVDVYACDQVGLAKAKQDYGVKG